MFQESIAILALTAGLTAGAQRPEYTVAPVRAPVQTPIHFFVFSANVTVVPQRPLQGRVITTEGKPLVNATVSLMVDGTSEVISTTRTDSVGSYKLNVPPDGKYVLRVRSLGFTPVVVPVEPVDTPNAASAEIAMRAFDTQGRVATTQP